MFFRFLAEIRLRTLINHLKIQVLDPNRAIFIPPAPCLKSQSERDNMETKFDLLGKFVPAPCMVKRRNLVRLSAGGGGERKYLMNSEIKLSLGLQISGGGGLGRGEENN